MPTPLTRYKPQALLIGESPQASMDFVERLCKLGCKCWFATSYAQACALFRTRRFDLVLGQTRVNGASLLPLVDQLEGVVDTLFFSHTVENGSWWMPAIRRGRRCFGSAPAVRSREFGDVLDELIASLVIDSEDDRSAHVDSVLDERVPRSRPLKIGAPPTRANRRFGSGGNSADAHPRVSGSSFRHEPALSRREKH